MISNDLHIVKEFKGIDLKTLAQVDFDARVDTKFMFPVSKLNDFFTALKGQVCVLDMFGERQFHYKNVYFDYPNFEFFRQHHAGYLNRIKVRSRQYSEKGPFVFEIKKKTNKSKTEKRRIALPSFSDGKSDLTEHYLQDQLGIGFNDLTETIGINYSRITMADKAMTEKFTVDINLEAVYNRKTHLFEDVVIAEIKQERFSNNSLFVRELKKLKIYPSSFSKYCAAVLMHRPDIKHNRFKPLKVKLAAIIK
ncbi:MAG: polyphosphate polymerase domain-containing protein [Salibacteraceae bacterium]|nr:polyphosphate polymerase domain-containing protein [Salibacteraceae bacterium]